MYLCTYRTGTGEIRTGEIIFSSPFAARDRGNDLEKKLLKERDMTNLEDFLLADSLDLCSNEVDNDDLKYFNVMKYFEKSQERPQSVDYLIELLKTMHTRNWHKNLDKKEIKALKISLHATLTDLVDQNFLSVITGEGSIFQYKYYIDHDVNKPCNIAISRLTQEVKIFDISNTPLKSSKKVVGKRRKVEESSPEGTYK